MPSVWFSNQSGAPCHWWRLLCCVLSCACGGQGRSSSRLDAAGAAPRDGTSDSSVLLADVDARQADDLLAHLSRLVTFSASFWQLQSASHWAKACDVVKLPVKPCMAGTSCEPTCRCAMSRTSLLCGLSSTPTAPLISCHTPPPPSLPLLPPHIMRAVPSLLPPPPPPPPPQPPPLAGRPAAAPQSSAVQRRTPAGGRGGRTRGWQSWDSGGFSRPMSCVSSSLLGQQRSGPASKDQV